MATKRAYSWKADHDEAKRTKQIQDIYRDIRTKTTVADYHKALKVVEAESAQIRSRDPAKVARIKHIYQVRKDNLEDALINDENLRGHGELVMMNRSIANVMRAYHEIEMDLARLVPNLDKTHGNTLFGVYTSGSLSDVSMKQARDELRKDPNFVAWEESEMRKKLEGHLVILRKELDAIPWMRRHNRIKEALTASIANKAKGEKVRNIGFFAPPVTIPLPLIFFMPPPVPVQPPLEKPRQFEPSEWFTFLFSTFNTNVFSNLLPDIKLVVHADSKDMYGWYSYSHFEYDTLLEHAYPHNPFAINVAAGALKKSWHDWKNTVLHEMCHYWIGLMEMKCNRKKNLGHGPDWQAVCCHAMTVYPDIILAETDDFTIDCQALLHGNQSPLLLHYPFKDPSENGGKEKRRRIVS